MGAAAGADGGAGRETASCAAAMPVPTTGASPPIDRRYLVVGLVIAAIVVADQVTKWWAWRHSATVTINSGGDELVGDVVGSWFRSAIAGAVLDIADAAALAAAMAAMLGRRRPLAVQISTTVFLAGWISNLLDRLGMHYWTAPGSVRGAVDFLRLGGGAVYNGADVVIVVGAICLSVSLCWYRHEQGEIPGPDTTTPADLRRPNPRRATWVLAGLVAVTVLAAYGVTHAGFMYAPARLWAAA